MDEVRTRMHGLWASVAPGWGEHADFVDRRGAGMTARLLDMAAPQPGERVLELACGPGGLGLAAAARVAPGGEVVVSDVAAEMTAIAAARARAAGLQNVTALVLDLEDIDEPDGGFDAVLCPGGRAAVAVWGPRERNPWLGLVFDALAAQLGRPVPPAGVPGPFSLGDAAALAALLREAGFAGVSVSEVAVPLQAG